MLDQAEFELNKNKWFFLDIFINGALSDHMAKRNLVKFDFRPSFCLSNVPVFTTKNARLFTIMSPSEKLGTLFLGVAQKFLLPGILYYNIGAIYAKLNLGT